MKKSFYPFIATIITILFISSCELLDKPDDGMANYLKVNGEDNELNAGFFENYGMIVGTETYDLRLSLYSDGLTIHDSNGKIDSVSGKGNLLYFELVTSSGTIIDNGEYLLDPTRALKTFNKPVYIVNWNASDKKKAKTKLTGGKLVFQRTGNEYELKYEGTDEFGLEVTGYYKGVLNYYNRS